MTIRLIAYAVAALALAWVGWTVNGWRADSARLVTVKADLKLERDKRADAERRRQEADDARTLASAQLEEFQETTRNEIAILRRRAAVLVNNSPACSFSRELRGVLDDARRGASELPGPARRPVGDTIAAGAAP